MENIFLTLLNMSISAGWVVAAVLMVRLFMRRVPRWIHCLLWALVGIRLIWPFSIESILSLIPSKQTVPPEILYMREPVIDTGVNVLNATINPVITGSFAPDPGTSVNPLQVWTWLAGWIWLIGLIAMVLYTVISTFRLSRRLREAVEIERGVWMCDSIETPFILGVFRPRIYLPSTMEQADREYVLAHERAHLKRHDHWWKPMGFALLSVYWFNPLLWLAYAFLCRDIELACDEKVIGELGSGSKKAYSTALINCSVPRRMLAACPLAFGEVGVKQRVKAVLNYKKPAFWVILAAVIVCIVASVCLLTDPREENTVQQYAVGGIMLEVPEGMLAEHSSHVSQLSDRTIYHERLHVRVSDDPYEPVHPGIVNIQYAELDATPERYGLPEGTSMQEHFLQQEGVVERVALSKLAPEDRDSVTNIRGTTRYVGRGIEALEVTCDAVIGGIDVSIRNLTFYEDGNEYTIDSRWRKDASQQQKENIYKLIDSILLMETELPDYRGLVAPMETSPQIMAIHCPPADEKGESAIQVTNVSTDELAKWLNTTQWQACNAPLGSLASPGSVEFILDSEYYRQRITVHQKKGATPFTYAVVDWRGMTRYYRIGVNDYDGAKALLEAPDFPVATQWFDYTDGYWPQNMDSQAYQPEKLVGTLSCTAEKLSLITEKETKTLYEGMPIWNAYFADLNDDGTREVCSAVSMGSGIIDNRIMVYDLAAGQCYELEARGKYDYNLLLNNGQLLVTQTDAATGETLMTGALALVDGQLQLVNGSTAESSAAYKQTEPAVQETEAAGTADNVPNRYQIGVLTVDIPATVTVDASNYETAGDFTKEMLVARRPDQKSDMDSIHMTIQTEYAGALKEAYKDFLKDGQTVNEWYVSQEHAAEELMQFWSENRLDNAKLESSGVTRLSDTVEAVDVTFTGQLRNENQPIPTTFRALKFYHGDVEYSVIAYWQDTALQADKDMLTEMIGSLQVMASAPAAQNSPSVNGQWYTVGALKVQSPKGAVAERELLENENMPGHDRLGIRIGHPDSEWPYMSLFLQCIDIGATEEAHADILKEGQSFNDWYISKDNVAEKLIETWSYQRLSDVKTISTTFTHVGDGPEAVDVTFSGKSLGEESGIDLTYRVMQFYHKGMEYSIVSYWRKDAPEQAQNAAAAVINSMYLVEDNGSQHRLGDLKVRVPEGMLANYSVVDQENDLYQECLTLSVPMTGNELNKAYMDIRFFDNDSTEERYAEYLKPGQTVNDWYIHQENAHRDLMRQYTDRLASDWKKLDSGFFPLSDSVAAVDVTVQGYWLNDNRDAVTVRALKFYHGGREYVVTAYLRDDAAAEEKAALKTAIDSLRLS